MTKLQDVLNYFIAVPDRGITKDVGLRKIGRHLLHGVRIGKKTQQAGTFLLGFYVLAGTITAKVRF